MRVRIFSLVILFICLGSYCLAFQSSPLIELNVPTTLATDPGEFVTFVIKVKHSMSENQKLNLKVGLPEQWRVLKLPDMIDLAPGEVESIFLSVAVPNDQQSGSYQIKISLSTKEIVVEKLVEVNIKPVYLVGLALARRETNLTIGTSYEERIFVKNFGNEKDRYILSVMTNGPIEITGLPREIELQPGEEIEINYSIHAVDKKVDSFSTIEFNIFSDHLGRSVEITQLVKMVYVSDSYSDKDFYWKLPSYTTFWVEGGDKKNLICGGNLRLEGEYDDQYWLVVGVESSNILFQQGSYYINVGDETTNFSLGDLSIPVSAIGNVAGKGIKLQKNSDNQIYTFGYIRKPGKSTYTFGGQWEMNKSVSPHVGVILFSESDHLYGILGVGANLVFTEDYLMEINLRHNWQNPDPNGFSAEIVGLWKQDDIQIKGKYYYVQPNYLQDQKDVQGVEILAGVRVLPELYTSGVFGVTKNNILNDPTKLSTLQRQINFYSSYTSNRFPTIALGFGDQKEQDVDNLEASMQKRDYYLGMTHQLGDLMISIGGKVCSTDHLKTNNKYLTEYYRGRLYLRKIDWTSWLLYESKTNKQNAILMGQEEMGEIGLKYQPVNSKVSSWLNFDWNHGEKELSGQLEAGVGYQILQGLAGDIRLREEKQFEKDSGQTVTIQAAEMGFTYKKSKETRWQVSNQIRLEHKHVEDRTTLYWSLEPRLEYDLTDNLSLSANVAKRWAIGENREGSFEFKVSLGKSFDLPIPWVREFAEVNGVLFVDQNQNNIFDQGDRPLRDVLLSIGNINALSNDEGKYIFPPLESGEYDVEIISPLPGLDSKLALPLTINLARGTVKTIDIPFIEVAAISGQVFLDSDQDGKEGIDSIGIPGVKVTVQGKNQTYSLLTNEYGYYYVKVEPGKYTISLDSASLPNRFITSSEVECIKEVKCGKTAIVNFGAYEKAREILFTLIKNTKEVPVYESEKEVIEKKEESLSQDQITNTDTTKPVTDLNRLEVNIDQREIYYQDKTLPLKPIIDDSVWIPIRSVATLLDARLYWNGENNIVYMVDERNILCNIDEGYINIGSDHYDLSQKLLLREGHTYISLEDLKILGLYAEVNGNTISINKKEEL